ncbi:MAG: hypothetical protein MGG11_12650 [Trichodesmium sp. MAG_R03]|nr:hypothetical protein [Trichodesmium sp. MAG_R03]
MLKDKYDTIISFVSEKIPLKRVGKPEDVAEAVIMLMNNGYISGEILNLTGGEQITGGEYITNVFKARGHLSDLQKQSEDKS